MFFLLSRQRLKKGNDERIVIGGFESKDLKSAIRRTKMEEVGSCDDMSREKNYRKTTILKNTKGRTFYLVRCKEIFPRFKFKPRSKTNPKSK